ncbi:hypothetical protein [Streptomyces sp. NPDC056132]|uniref:hypothetical protein n=1 Tax=Streptomyces sp. NPDC056132 TaxID=3345722 RepID=UPI0035D7811F
MVDLPEEAAAAALRVVAELGQQRAELLAQADALTPRLREAAVSAARAGATRSRVRELAGVSPKTLYAWLDDAGVAIRPNRRPAE